MYIAYASSPNLIINVTYKAPASPVIICFNQHLMTPAL